VQRVLFDKASFIREENKNQLMHQILVYFRDFEAGIKKYEGKEPDSGQLQQINEALGRQLDEIQREMQRQLQELRAQIGQISEREDKIRRDLESKRIRMENVKRLAEEKFSGMPQMSGMAGQIRQELGQLCDRYEAEKQNRQREIESLQADRQRLEAEIREADQRYRNEVKRLEEEGRRQIAQISSTADQTEALKNRLREVLPGKTVSSALRALKRYDITDVMRLCMGEEQYLLQCVTGTMSYMCKTQEGKDEACRYTALLMGNAVTVPYVLGRNRAVYQTFLYHEQDKAEVWQHFQTICAAQILLHEKIGYTLQLVSENHGPFLEDMPWQRPYTAEAAGKAVCPAENTGQRQYPVADVKACEAAAVLDELEIYCDEMIHTVLGSAYQYLWEYNKAHVLEPLPYKGLVFWDFPRGLDARTVQRLAQIYGKAEKCGVFLLFMVNVDTDMSKDMENQVVSILNGLNALQYVPDRQCYEEMVSPEIIFRIDRYEDVLRNAGLGDGRRKGNR